MIFLKPVHFFRERYDLNTQKLLLNTLLLWLPFLYIYSINNMYRMPIHILAAYCVLNVITYSAKRSKSRKLLPHFEVFQSSSDFVTAIRQCQSRTTFHLRRHVAYVREKIMKSVLHVYYDVVRTVFEKILFGRKQTRPDLRV